MSSSDAERASNTTDTPLTLTKRGAIIYARKSVLNPTQTAALQNSPKLVDSRLDNENTRSVQLFLSVDTCLQAPLALPHLQTPRGAC